jgi:Trypsin-co-occurring domain 1
MATRSHVVRATLADGSSLHIEATPLSEEEDVVSLKSYCLKPLTNVIEQLSISLLESIKKAKPRKATVEFNFEIATEAGELTALLVKGSGKASIKVTLEWGE